MPRSIKHAAVLPPQFTGKTFLLEVREHFVYIPSQIDYPYLYCKLRQHILKSHIVKQFQTPDHGQGVSFRLYAAQPSAFITDITVFCNSPFLFYFILCAYSCGISTTARKSTDILWDLRESENLPFIFFNCKKSQRVTI